MHIGLEEFLGDYAGIRSVSSILIIAWMFPAAFTRFRGRLTYYGVTPVPGPIASADFEVHIRAGDADLIRALEQHQEAGGGAYDLVYIDANHQMSVIARQINGALPFTSAETLFVLPGVSPPSRGMATPAPTRDWWVGDVWTLPNVLRRSSAEVLTHPMAPTGVLLASGVKRLDTEEAERIAADQQAAVADDQAFHDSFQHASLSKLVEVLEARSPVSSDRNVVRVIVDPSEPEICESIWIDEERAWKRPPPVFVHDLSSNGLPVSHLQRAERVVHGTRVDTFRDVLLAGRDVILAGSLQDNVMRAYVKNYRQGPTTGWLKMIAEEPSQPADIITSLYEADEKLVVDRGLLEQATPLSDPVFLGTPDEFLNYGMWLLYSVPSVPLFRKMQGEFPHYMAYMGRSWQRQMLLDLGLQASELVDHRIDQFYRASAVATMRHSFRSLSLSAADREAFDDVASRALGGGALGPERIFVSRRGHTKAGAYRGLTNEDQLIDRLNELGFAIIEPEQHSIMEQARLFRRAKVVVGLGGAGMFNVAFCRPGTLVIDIESGADWIDAHAELFASVGAEYGFILGDIDETDPAPVHKRWSVDVDRAVDIIREHG